MLSAFDQLGGGGGGGEERGASSRFTQWGVGGGWGGGAVCFRLIQPVGGERRRWCCPPSADSTNGGGGGGEVLMSAFGFRPIQSMRCLRVQQLQPVDGGAVHFQPIQPVGVCMYVNFYYKGGGGGMASPGHVTRSENLIVLSQRDRVPYAVLYIGCHASALDTWAVFHTTLMQGQHTSQNEHLTFTRISRSAYSVGIFIIVCSCRHTSDQRMQILCTSCIQILYNAPTDLHTEDRQDRYTRYIRLNPIYTRNN